MKVIFACGRHGQFGLEGGLPWDNISEDMKHFKEFTDGHPMVMGRKTFESLPGKLPGRKHIVISSKEVPGADEVISSLYDAPSDSIVIGGARLIELAIISALASEISMTMVDGDHEADVYINLPLIRDHLEGLPFTADIKDWGSIIQWKF